MVKREVRVLLIEDNPGDVRLIELMLSEAEEGSFVLKCADRLSKGLEIAAAEKVDVLLLDLSLPDCAGIETFKRARAGAPDVPIVVLTGFADTDQAILSVREGAQDYLVKGQVDSNLLVRAIYYAIERKNIQDALQETREQYRQLVELLPDTLCVMEDGVLVFTNRAGARLAGVQDPEQLIGMSIYSIVHPDYHQQLDALRKQVVEQGRIGHCMEAKVVRADGSFVDVEIVPAPMTYEGKPAIMALIRDISVRKREETMLRQEKQRFYEIINNSPNLISIHSPDDWKFVDANDSFFRITGYDREDIIGRSVAEAGIIQASRFPLDRDQLREGHPILNQEITFRLKSGEIRTGFVSANVINLCGDPFLLVTISDITEQRKFEKEMSRLERLNLMGEMAAGIAHEIRNPMTAVRALAQMLAAKEECRAYENYFNLIIEELDRANSTLSEFLNLGRNKQADMKLQDLNQIIKTMFLLVQGDALASGKSAVLDLKEDLPLLMLDKQEIRQLILNLARNGLEAMPSGGVLSMSTRVVGSKVALSVSDQGPGVEPDLLDKLGTPFFTTKETGTGLGLSLCYSIAARHNAALTMETGPSGTTFSVYFQA